MLNVNLRMLNTVLNKYLSPVARSSREIKIRFSLSDVLVLFSQSARKKQQWVWNFEESSLKNELLILLESYGFKNCRVNIFYVDADNGNDFEIYIGAK